jgi:AGCS family alanine or glycine:cation symporter
LDLRITAGIIAVLLGMIIFGGVKRIARVGEIAVPFMSVGYVLVVLIILILNYQHIPAVFSLIFRSAFGLEPAFSGMLGATISMGVKRGIFSNEAGQGTGAHAAAACEVPHPAKQGLVQAFSVYVDTLLICSATAFVILITGTYKVYDAAHQVVFSGHAISETVTTYGPVFTQLAVDTTIPGFGSAFVAIALFFFAFTTIMSYYFQAETNVYFLFRKEKTAFYMVNLLRIAILMVSYFTAINTMDLAWGMADIGVGMMAWLNLIAILLLHKKALLVFSDFEKQYRSGIKEPVFRPKELGIDNAEIWDEIH